MKKIIIILILLTIFLSSKVIAPNGEPLQEDLATTTTYDSNGYNLEYKFYKDGRIEPGGRVPPDYFGKITPIASGEFEVDGRKYTLNTEDSIIRNRDGSANIVKARKVETKDITTGETTSVEDAENGVINNDGSYQYDRVKRLVHGNNIINNGFGVKFQNGILTAKHADSFIKDTSVTTNIDNLNARVDIFSVEKADSFLSDCIRVDNIKDSEFKVSNIVEITTKSNVNLKITDCSYNEVEFKGKGKVSIDKSSDNPKYIVQNGTLTKKENEYNERVESNNSIIIETDKTFGFKCLTINPIGSYFYNDKDLRKDFIINIPKESSTYKLCLRKNQLQQFKDFDGLVDFINKKIELNGVVNYLRYPLKNNQISSLLSYFVYRGLKNVKTLLTYDNNLLFLNNVNIKNVLNNYQQITITKPNNYYDIKEIELEDGKIHRIVELNKITKNQLIQDINYNYESDNLEPKITINDGVFIQDNGKNRIAILPLEYSKIGSFLK